MRGWQGAGPLRLAFGTGSGTSRRPDTKQKRGSPRGGYSVGNRTNVNVQVLEGMHTVCLTDLVRIKMKPSKVTLQAPTSRTLQERNENNREKLSVEKEQVVWKARYIDRPLVRPTEKEKTSYENQA